MSERKGYAMSTIDLESYVEEMQSWEKIAEEAKSEAEALRDKIKADMMQRDVEEMEAGRFIVRWTSVLTNRFDSTAFKREHGDLYKDYVKQVSSKRFSVAARSSSV